jgi:hypothetical protein
MVVIKMPGFTAENAIHETAVPYRITGVARYQRDPKSTLIGPAMRPDPFNCVLSCIVTGGGYRCFTRCLGLDEGVL